MIGPVIVAVGWLFIIIAAVVVWGPLALGAAGVVTVLVGLFADLESLRSPKRA